MIVLFQKLTRILFFFVGLLLFQLPLSLTGPCQSTNIETSGSVFQDVTLKLQCIHYSVTVAGIWLFTIVFVLLALLVLVSCPARRGASLLFHSPRELFAVLVPVAVFLFTLIPTEEGLPIILYLMIAGTGLAYLLWGIAPLALRIRAWIPQIQCFWLKVVALFYGLKPFPFALLVFAIPFALTNVCSYFVFRHIPHVQDNIDQVFHAKIFASGHLTVPSHPCREFFDFRHNINNGRWYSQYPPGHTFLLMLGVLVGAPWLVNPLLGSASIVLFYLVGRRLYEEKTGRLAALLGILSPFIVFMSSEFFSHTTVLFFLCLFVLLFAKTISRASKWWHAMLTGLALGLAFIARQYTAVGVAIPYAIYSLYLTVRNPRENLPRFMVMVVGFMLIAGLLPAFNYLTNGSPWVSGYEVLYGKQHNPGFGHSGWGPPHTPLKGLRQDLNDLNALQKYLFEWCVPSTIFVLIYFLGKRKTKWDYLFIGSVFTLPFVHFFYWYQEWCFGPRFDYESTLPLVLLTARGILKTPEVIQERFGGENVGTPRFFTTLTLIACIAVALTANFPALVREYTSSYWHVNTDVQRLVAREKITNALIFVRSYYGSVFAENTPTLNGAIVYALDLGSQNCRLMKYFPGRRYYRANEVELEEIPEYFYDNLEAPICDNSDFEMGTFDGWFFRGEAWGIADFARPDCGGKFHAESLGGGPDATGILRSVNFVIEENTIRFLKNGWSLDPSKPNRYLLVDAKTGKELRSASPPNQEGFVPQFWDVADLIGREVYFLAVDNDDDALRKDGRAWLGVDDITMGDVKPDRKRR